MPARHEKGGLSGAVAGVVWATGHPAVARGSLEAATEL